MHALRGRGLMPEQRSAIRYSQTGGIKDVAITGDLFRIERLGPKEWWICVYRDGKRTAFNMSSLGGRTDLKLLEDEIGCRDDQKERT